MIDPLLSRTCEHASRYLSSRDGGPVGAAPDLERLALQLGVALPTQRESPERVIERLAVGARPGLVASTGGRYFGFVVGATLPAALAADWLTSAWDQNAGFHVLSPAAAVLERIVATWLKDLLGLPDEAVVGFVTGCQMANVMGMASGRQSVVGRAGWDVARQGLHGAPPVRIIVSAEAHGTIDRAAALLGLGADTLVRVACDRQGRMIADELAAELGRAPGPTIVCAQAGNVNTGSFDPLR